MWLLVRIAILISTSLAIFNYPSERSNLTWAWGLVIASIVGVVTFIRFRTLRDCSLENSFSLFEPLLPVGRYPGRIWFLGALGFTLGGLSSLIGNLVWRHGNTGFGSSFLLIGAAIIVGLFLALKTRRA